MTATKNLKINKLSKEVEAFAHAYKHANENFAALRIVTIAIICKRNWWQKLLLGSMHNTVTFTEADLIKMQGLDLKVEALDGGKAMRVSVIPDVAPELPEKKVDDGTEPG